MRRDMHAFQRYYFPDTRGIDYGAGDLIQKKIT